MKTFRKDVIKLDLIILQDILENSKLIALL